ncbi:MAG: hypothetical protein M1834_003819 [Cirrosporium novae-zelandiae]|nr:MAG: hypothetical protein M1834_003819 [Cirrosporium novae-zelandiae]
MPQATELETKEPQLMESSRIWVATLDRTKEDLATLLKLPERKRKRKYGDASSIHVVTLEEAICHSDFNSFQYAMQTLAEQFAKRKVSTFISNAAAYFPNQLKKSSHSAAALQSLLPYFQKDLSMYPRSTALQYSLQSIFEDYIDFCLEIIRHFAKHPLWAFVRNIVSSSLRQNLRRLKDKLKNDVAEFDRAVESAERARARQADDTMLNSQSQLLLLAHQSHVSQKSNTPQDPKFPIHSVNIAENPDFTGREDELDTLYRLLVESHTEPRPVSCTIHGIGGIGKTSTALKFTYTYREKFDAVFWVSADPEQETETLRTFSNIGRRLGLFDSDVIQESQVEIVLDWLQTEERRWLIVFDNVVEWKSIARYWPTRSRNSSAIIVTAQKIAPWANHELDLAPLDDQAGSKLLLQQMHISQLDVDDPTWSIASEISKELGGSPLYLTQAQGFMSLSGCTPKDYLDSIRARSNTLDWKSNSIWRYGKAVLATHDRILEELSDGARNLLFMLAFRRI